MTDLNLKNTINNYSPLLTQAFQIANLIREYTEVLQSPHEVRRREVSTKKRAGNGNNRPVSILHKPAPVIEPQPS